MSLSVYKVRYHLETPCNKQKLSDGQLLLPIILKATQLAEKYAYQFNRKEKEEELEGNYAYEFRMYDPAIGRWWQQDPVIKENESPYAGYTNNPVMFSDLLGLDTFNIHLDTHNIFHYGNDPNSTSLFHTYNVFDGPFLMGSYNLPVNEWGYVEFPAAGHGFGRYGGIDKAGGKYRTFTYGDYISPTEKANVSSITAYYKYAKGDHFLKPHVAAELFGLISEFHVKSGYKSRIDIGDLSNEIGEAPGWDHSTHGGPKFDRNGDIQHYYKGAALDYRYFNSSYTSYQGGVKVIDGQDFAPYFDQDINKLFYQMASNWGFTSNYSPLRAFINDQQFSSSNSGPMFGHDDHGHLGYKGVNRSWLDIFNFR
ncbi:RHS repeat-associated core domain-containing protein [Algivirga pacifica]|uniref:RHS repeat-associated core domain-containing protein n=1 Tax=Algivirga pacifica TaxID=1162670 RepID=A0ABP9DJE1_9BACT